MSEYTKNLNLFKYDPINDAKVPFDIEKCLNENWDKIDEKVAGMPVGTIFAHTCSASFIPENSLPCDGGEYTQAQFPSLYTNWLVSGNLNTCTYEEYESDISTYGKCVKWGLDTINGKFKVPTIPDGTYITQALSDDELGKSYKESLPNIKGTFIAGTWGSGINGTGAFSSSTSVYQGTVSGTSAAFYKSTGSLNASDSSSTYQDNAKVQGENVRLRHFVVVATGSINQSQMDWSAWASSLQGKANIDANNFTTLGQQAISTLSAPSDTRIPFTINASGATYQSPVDGYVVFCKEATTTGQYTCMVVYDSTQTKVKQWLISLCSISGRIETGGTLRVDKNDIIYIKYTAVGNVTRSYIVPTNAFESEGE